MFARLLFQFLYISAKLILYAPSKGKSKMMRIGFIFILLTYHAYSPAAVIDCQTTNTLLADVVCKDARLKRLNQRLNQVYAQSSEVQQQTQKVWQEELITACPHKMYSCLKQQYEYRIREMSKKVWHFNAQIHPDLLPFDFELAGVADQDTAHVHDITVLNAEQHIVQTLIIEDVSDMLTETETLWLDRGEGFKIEDINFDGYKDIRLMELLPAGANVPYLYWLYHPKQQHFIFSKAFSQLAHITLDMDKKQVISQYRINAVEHGTDYYTVDNYELTLVRQELTKYIKNEEGELILFDMVKQRTDGQLHIISQEPVQ